MEETDLVKTEQELNASMIAFLDQLIRTLQKNDQQDHVIMAVTIKERLKELIEKEAVETKAEDYRPTVRDI